jgi:predicted DNA-binding protein
MAKAITVRIPTDLAEWLEATARQRGVTKAQVARDALEGLRNAGAREFLRLAGAVSGARNLSVRQGFSRH